MTPIVTDRLELRTGSAAIYRIHFDDSAALAAALGVTVTDEWPVEHYDQPVVDLCAQRLNEGQAAEWLMRYVIERESDTLAGIIGSGGEPEEGAFVVGYSILPFFRRRGFASEALGGLLRWAFEQKGVDRAVAETYPHLTASIRTLEKNGFALAGPGSEEATIRYERRK